MKTETINGKEYQAVVGTGEETDCDNCALRGESCRIYLCDHEMREDGNDVYFVEVGNGH